MRGENLIMISKFLLLFVGLWTLHLKKNNIYTKVYKIYSVVTKVLYCSFMASLAAQFAILIKENDNLERIIASLALVIVIMENATKYVIYQKNQIPDMFKDIIENERQIWMTGEEEVIKNYKKQVKFCRIINIFQLIAIISATGMFAINSFIEYYTFGITAFERKPFMHDNWYPFVMEKHMTFVMVFQMYYLVIGGSINVATLTTFAVVLIFAATKLRLLQIRIKNIGKRQANVGTKQLEAEVKKLIEEHQYVLR